MCQDQFERCVVTGWMKGWCLPGHEAERDAARIERFYREAADRPSQQERIDRDMKLTRQAAALRRREQAAKRKADNERISRLLRQE